MSALVPLLIVAGCSTAPTAPDGRSGPSTPSKSSSSSRSASGAPVMPAAGSGRGGYYKDDGPGDDIPEGLQNTADAVPTIEPYSRTGNKPYVVFGKTYTPLIDDKPFKQRGIGSWYGKKFHKQRTSSGEPYDMYKMTAAHPTLPIPSYARVTNLKTGKQIIVRINDRGPFHSTRIIDLSYTAALRLGYLGSGSSELEVERLLPADILAMNKSTGASVPDPLDGATAMAVNSPSVDSTALELMASPRPQPGLVSDVAGADSIANRPDEHREKSQSNPTAQGSQGYYLQLGAFSRQPNAEMERQRLLQQLPGIVSTDALDDVAVGGIYRLYAGPYATRPAAEEAAALVRQRAAVNAIIVLK
ncbi:septal ring lytic transglycosylase RlpA family protein [Glaciimonas sp. PAMC28666]|uniref:septal ring lytic transglycosylase RlpA family protein n=1 Tax=Glaciimonas sp. PAMC28666 TaxID=2807626 RepID=UPI001965E63D|nr:septal ring lytic transglycosylase RlpA family protein [Glaciimonas sp. PAMC28666]QRX84028.1 septal ring lytic transglycosylase RlpA family protein [Glaciimonas sp. PAMC28666]